MGWRFFCFFARNVYLCSIIRLSTYKTNKKMRKTIITMLFACAALFTFNACVVSEQKLTEKVQEAIIDAEKQDGNKLEITEFDLGEKTLNVIQKISVAFTMASAAFEGFSKVGKGLSEMFEALGNDSAAGSFKTMANSFDAIGSIFSRSTEPSLRWV